MPDDLILDPWTPLAHKQVFGDPSTGAPAAFRNAPWLTETDRRRLSAYIVLGAYAENSARSFLPSDNERRDEVREYGDASLVIEQALSSLLGESQSIVVDRADEYDPDQGDSEPADGQTPPDPDDLATIQHAADWQERLRAWADSDGLFLTMLGAERDAVTLGDAVYVVSWDPEKQRVRTMTVDPGMYFPSVPSGRSLRPDQFPDRVDFLWSIPADPVTGEREKVTRLTYRLGLIMPALDVDGMPVLDDEGAWVLDEGDRWNADTGMIERDVPWSDEPVDRTCYMTQVTWDANDIGRIPAGGGVDRIPTEDAIVDIPDTDLRIDFVPVVHVPNTWPGAHVFGQALISKAVQVLDDLHMADTDSSAASSTTGSPIIAVSGGTVVAQRRGGGLGRDMGNVPSFDIRPGMVLSLAADGSLSTVDTSNQLRAVREYVEDLRGRFTQNVRIPDVALGLVGDAANQMSGLAIELRYGPMQSLVRGMRQVRSAKYAVLLRFVQRMMMLADDYDGPPRPARAEVLFGSFMPRDTEGALERIVTARREGAISLETTVLLLQQAGVPIEDVAAEVEKIERRDFQRATYLLDATDDPDAVRRYLHLPERTVTVMPPGTPLPASGARPRTQ